VPGLLSIVILSAYAFVHELYFNKSKWNDYARHSISWSRIKITFLEGIWDWPIILIIVAGVYGGFVTIAEVSALVLVYVVVVECFILKEVKFLRELPNIMIESAVLSGAIIVILGFALGFTGYLVDEQIPNRILEFLTS